MNEVSNWSFYGREQEVRALAEVLERRRWFLQSAMRFLLGLPRSTMSPRPRDGARTSSVTPTRSQRDA